MLYLSSSQLATFQPRDDVLCLGVPTTQIHAGVKYVPLSFREHSVTIYCYTVKKPLPMACGTLQ